MTVTLVIDGDTIVTSAGTVRLIGIDAPEQGECGYAEAAGRVAAAIAVGDVVELTLPAGQNDEDQYGRLLRYVTTSTGADVGFSVVAGGLAVARYDSMDGYPEHPRETEYHAAQLATLSAEGVVITVDCQAAQLEAAEAEQARIAAEQAAAAPPTVNEWWRQYSSCSKLQDNPNGLPTGPFSRDDSEQAAIYDWFENGTGNHGDGDLDGLACE